MLKKLFCNLENHNTSVFTMLKALKYFFVAVLLFGAAKFLAIVLIKDYSPEEKKAAIEVKEQALEKKKKSVAEKAGFSDSKESSSEEDSIAMVETPVEEPAKKQAVAAVSQGNTKLIGEDYFQDLKNSYLSPIIAKLPEGRSREDVVVRYYRHNMDNDRVYALRRLGYYLHEKEPEDSKDLESNVLYYGREVDIRDIQLVAYTLMKNGVPLRAIKQSQFDWKLSAIEIGTDSLLQDSPLLTAASIESFQR